MTLTTASSPTLLRPVECAVPPDSAIAARLSGADFVDAWTVEAADPHLPALGQFLLSVAATPAWVERLMSWRNRLVSRLGLKDLGGLGSLDRHRPAEAYQPGDRVGIFTLFQNAPHEALLGDRDKHLDVVLSVFKTVSPDGRSAQVTVTTVVHTHNAWGRLYMLPVAPMHKLIVPAVLKAIGHPARA